jgi:hypothetical protein
LSKREEDSYPRVQTALEGRRNLSLEPGREEDYYLGERRITTLKIRLAW